MASHLLWYILTCIILIGFFAGTEIAFVSANKLNIELRKKQGGIWGRILGHFFDQPVSFFGTTLVGMNIAMVVYGLLMIKLTEPVISSFPPPFNSEYIHLFVDTFIATAIILIFAEFLPKTLFRSKAEQVLSFFALPMWLMYQLLYPVARIFVSVSEFILKYLFNVRIKENQAVFNRINMDHFIRQSLHGQESEANQVNTELFENALKLVNLKVRKCLIPRNEIISVEAGTPVDSVKELFIKTRLSRIVVYKENIDHIIGYLHHRDFFAPPASVPEALHAIPAIPEAMSAVDLLNHFTKERKSIAWVIDEFGGTAGIITMEDVLEKIFGDIRDEYDVVEYLEMQIAAHEFLLSGRLTLDYLNKKYRFEFPVSGQETLSGYIISKHGAIPKMKERIIIGLYEFDILRVSETRIETVKMKVLQPL